jgi:hypothetical protein
VRAALDFANSALQWAKLLPVFAGARLRLAWLSRSPEHRHAIEVIRNSALFDAEYYTSRYQDVKRSGVVPLAHYVAWGTAEGRSPHILFSPEFYRQHHPRSSGTNDLVRWIERGAAEGFAPHPLFDVQFYLRNNPAATDSGMDPLTHFLRNGGPQGLDPHPLFDSSFYSGRNPRIAQDGVNPLVHYLRDGHHKEGCSPHPLFDESFYCRQNTQVAQGDTPPLLHYVRHGTHEDYAPHPLFDGQYYLSRYPDVGESGLNPLAHYIEHGASALRHPHPLFDTEYYCAQTSSAMVPNFNPLLHYIEEGGRRGLNPYPLFDSQFYVEQCQDFDAARMTPLEHYLRHGALDGKNPHPLFDSSFYLEQNPDVMNAGTNPLVHYVKHGVDEGRCPNPWFDPAWYVKEYPEVARAGVDPLIHYLQQGAAQGKNPHPMFQTAWYLEANPDVASAGANPLVHYLRYGWAEGRLTRSDGRRALTVAPVGSQSAAETAKTVSPAVSQDIEVLRPLFDVPFYVKQCPELAQGRVNPYQHYLTRGAGEGRDPHPLFDTSFYLANNPDVALAGGNPLLHFAQYGGFEGRDPHPLFDASYYLETYRDVAKLGINPLVHYLRYGYAEGRQPNPMFDSGYYLQSNPDVRESKLNPLVHFIESGAREGRNPHPAFDVRSYLEHYPDIATSGINPLTHYFGPPTPRMAPTPPPAVALPRKNPQPGRYTVEALNPSDEAQPFRTCPTILCVTHVSPFPPRAGNEYAEYRIFDYMERHGYRIVLLLSSLPGEELTDEQFRVLCDRFPYSILCGHDGLVQHRLPDGATVLNELAGAVPQPLGPELGEDLDTDPQERTLVGQERTFCHDFLARLALHLEATLSPCIVLSEYIFHTRFLPLVRSGSLKVIETIDMFSSKRQKVIQFGVADTFGVTPVQERMRLLRADLILSCQRTETQAFADLVPERPVLEVPFDFDIADQMQPSQGPIIFYVASDNLPNTKGFADFLNLAWPVILREVPDAELLVAGKICRTVKQPAENVRLLGQVDNLRPLYEKAKLTINPAVAGTGMKIKTAEALSYLRPVVNWPAGVDGFPPELTALCPTARSWPEFADHVIAILRSPTTDWFSDEQKLRIRHLLSPDTIYAPLLKYFDSFCERQKISRRGMAGAAARSAR